MQLDGRIALVTGASRGIGAAIARELAAEGARVVVNYQNNADAANAIIDEIRTAGGQAHAVAADVSNQEDVTRLLQATEEHFGGLDILVNNAGIWIPGRMGDVTFADWRKQMAVNLDSMFLCVTAALQMLRKSKAGRIISISSRCARKGEENSGPYVATKAAMLGLTRTLALELGHDGITANCVAPAWTASDMTDDYFQQHGNLDEVLKTIPLGRIGQPEDIAKAVVYLASDASGYMSGETLFLAGGAI